MDAGLKTILILVIVFGSIGAGRYLRHRTKIMELKINAEREYSLELKEEMDRIRDRLSTLEKIVTDKGYRLKEEIDDL